jgi:hypothetical protein
VIDDLFPLNMVVTRSIHLWVRDDQTVSRNGFILYRFSLIPRDHRNALGLPVMILDFMK